MYVWILCLENSLTLRILCLEKSLTLRILCLEKSLTLRILCIEKSLTLQVLCLKRVWQYGYSALKRVWHYRYSALTRYVSLYDSDLVSKSNGSRNPWVSASTNLQIQKHGMFWALDLTAAHGKPGTLWLGPGSGQEAAVTASKETEEKDEPVSQTSSMKENL